MRRRSTQTAVNPLDHVKPSWQRVRAVTSRESTQIYRSLKPEYIDIRLPPADRQGDQGGSRGGERQSTARLQTDWSFTIILPDNGISQQGEEWGGRKESQACTLPNTWLFVQSFAGRRGVAGKRGYQQRCLWGTQRPAASKSRTTDQGRDRSWKTQTHLLSHLPKRPNELRGIYLTPRNCCAPEQPKLERFSINKNLPSLSAYSTTPRRLSFCFFLYHLSHRPGLLLPSQRAWGVPCFVPFPLLI